MMNLLQKYRCKKYLKLLSAVGTAAIILFTVITLNSSNTKTVESEGGFTIYPANSHKSSWLEKSLPVGSMDSEKFIVKNYSDQPLNLSLSFIESSGSKANIKLNEKLPPTNIGLWVNLNDSEIKLKPFEEKEISLSLKIPNSVRPDYYQGVLLASTSSETNNGNKLNTRIGSRVYLNITPPSVAQTSIFNHFIPNNFWLSLVAIIGLFFAFLPNKTNIRYEKNKY